MAAVFKTANLHGYSLQFSPFQADRLVCAASQHYGLSGPGAIFSIGIDADSQQPHLLNQLSWEDGVYDVAWSENDPNLVVGASGDGSLQLWNLDQKAPQMVYKEHSKEVYGVDWNKTRTEQHFISASWDHTIKLWDPLRPQSLSTFAGHSNIVYSAVWSPLVRGCFASVSGDGQLLIWSASAPRAPSMRIGAHDAEVLSCDWCKYQEHILVTAASDGLIRGWDTRKFHQPIFQQIGCQMAVRRVQFSPHHMSVLAAVSYDFTTRIWDFKNCSEPIETLKHHSEFVYGLDFNLHVPGQMADCGWDSLVCVFRPHTLEKQFVLDRPRVLSMQK